jgi:hypothetical protein
MGDPLAAQLAALADEVRAAALPDVCKHSVVWCLDQLPPLYANFRQTSESRHGAEITRLLEGMLKALVASQRVAPDAKQLGAGIVDRLQRLHEEFGLPGLHLRPSLSDAVRDRPVNRSTKSKGRPKAGRRATRKEVQVLPRQIEGDWTSKAGAVAPKKTLHAREKELRSLLTTAAGRAELQELASQYQSATGRPRPAGTSAITYIVVHERENGLIGN